jgi:hypothetical protein
LSLRSSIPSRAKSCFTDCARTLHTTSKAWDKETGFTLALNRVRICSAADNAATESNVRLNIKRRPDATIRIAIKPQSLLSDFVGTPGGHESRQKRPVR